MGFNKVLEQIDNFFETQGESEQQLIIFLPLLIFGFLSYYFLFPITDEAYNNSFSQKESLESDIEKLNRDINSLKSSNNQYVIKINRLKKEIATLSKEKEQLDKLLTKLKFFNFDLDKWAKFYNNIPNMARENRLIITSFQNELIKDNQNELIKRKIRFSIFVVGNFEDFIRFMYNFENKREFIKIENFFIKQNNMIFTIDIYGAEL